MLKEVRKKMLDKNKIKSLLSQKKYDDILKILMDEYRSILHTFFKKNNISFSNTDTMLDLILKLEAFFPQYKGFANLMSTAFFSEDLSSFNKINTLLDGYEQILTELT